MPRQSALVGQIAPLLDSLILSREDLESIVQHVSSTLSAVDLLVLFVFGWLLVPYTRIIYPFIRIKTTTKTKKVGSSVKKDDDDEAESERRSEEKNEFETSILFFIVDHCSQVARLAVLVYACDCVVIALEAVGYQVQYASKVFAKILYTSWLARLAQRFKRSLIRQILNRAPKNCDKIKLIDRIIDGMVLSILLVKILDYLSVETGIALGSIFAVGSTGTLIISLGSQEIAKGVVNGVEMAASDRFYEGDNVHFGDGTQGYIVKMGFLRTKIQKYDSAVVDIPNTQLGSQRVINISRCNICRVLTMLRFEYSDIQKIPKTLELIKEEIVESCPKLIKNGKKPFRAMISSFERDYVEATVNCSFEINPTGEEFWANREQMFLAIDRGVRKSEIRYARPVYQLQGALHTS